MAIRESKDDEQERKTKYSDLSGISKESDAKHLNQKENSRDVRGDLKSRDYLLTRHLDIIRDLIDCKTENLKLPDPDNANLEKDPYGKSLLHGLLRMKISDDREKERKKEKKSEFGEPALDYISQTVLEKPELLQGDNVENGVPLFDAARSVPSIFFLIMHLVLPRTIRGALENHKPACKGGDGCSLHGANLPLVIRKRHSIPDTPQMHVSFGRSLTSPPDKSRAHSQEGPCAFSGLHTGKILKEDDGLRKVLKGLIEPIDQAKCLFQSLINEWYFSQSESHPRIDLLGMEMLLDLSPDEVFGSAETEGDIPLQIAIGILDKGSLDMKTLFSFIKLLVSRWPASVFCKIKTDNRQPQSIFQLLRVRYKQLQTGEFLEHAKQLELMLKTTCIGYGVSKEPNTSFEVKNDYGWHSIRNLLTGDTHPARRINLRLIEEERQLDVNYLEKFTKRCGMKFEEVLGYVQLQYWDWKPAIPPKPSDQYQSAVKESTNDSGDPYVILFNWLRVVHGVKKIFVVDVDDDGSQPHTNAAIRKCLTSIDKDESPVHFGIEVWKWKKFDICIETIIHAAPDVRKVYLYSHGNTAVLKGWASEEGLAKLLKLEELIVEIHPQNKNDESDCNEYKGVFKRKICMYFSPNQIKVDIKISSFDASLAKATSPGFATDTSKKPALIDSFEDPQNIPKSNEWVEELSNYNTFINDANRKLAKKEKVRVAILDDGVNLVDIPEGEQVGETFHPRKEYCTGPCRHGTAVAKCVRQVCHSVELIICRLDDSRDNDSKQPFTIRSCTEALKSALKLEADIISMSWTFERALDSADDDKKEFENLVAEILQQKRAILVTSLPDKGYTSELKNFAPVGLPGVLKICSATEHGGVSQANLFEKPDFRLPGEGIADVWENQTVQGSSFATAYAAGLAALVLLSLRVFEGLSQELNLVNDVFMKAVRKVLEQAKHNEGMKDVLMSMAVVQEHQSSNYFLRPKNVLCVSDEDESIEHYRDQLGKVISDIENHISNPTRR